MAQYGNMGLQRPINLLRPQPKINHLTRRCIHNSDIAQVTAVEEDEDDRTAVTLFIRRNITQKYDELL
jgi:hypothetical protein